MMWSASRNIMIILVIGLGCMLKMVSAQEIAMEHKSAPSGGTMTDIELHPSGKLYVVADKNAVGKTTKQLYRSINKGDSWSKVDFFPPARDLDVDIDAAGNIWVAFSNYSTASSSIYKSSNDGESWVKMNTAVNPFLNTSTWSAELIKKAGSESTSPLYVSTSWSSSLAKCSLFRSDNDGGTWLEVYSNSSTLGAVSAHPNGTVLILGQLGVVRSASGQAGTFSQITNGLPTADLSYSFYQSFTQRHITWVGDVVYVIWPGVGLFRSVDYGISWTAESQFNTVISYSDTYTATLATKVPISMCWYRMVESGSVVRMASGQGEIPLTPFPSIAPQTWWLLIILNSSA